MTARPTFTERRRRPLSAAVALVLMMVALLLAAGCGSPVPDHKYPALSGEKYVYLHHTFNAEFSKNVNGYCVHFPSACAGSGFSFNESSGVLSMNNYLTRNGTINESLLLFYDYGHYQTAHCSGNSWTFVYSLPADMKGNVTIETITGDGTVSLRFKDIPITLKPGERWENTSNQLIFGFNVKPNDCSEEYVVTESFSNAGVFYKSDIVFSCLDDGRLPNTLLYFQNGSVVKVQTW